MRGVYKFYGRAEGGERSKIPRTPSTESKFKFNKFIWCTIKTYCFNASYTRETVKKNNKEGFKTVKGTNEKVRFSTSFGDVCRGPADLL